MINWSEVPEYRIFQLNFPQPSILPDKYLEQIMEAKRQGERRQEMRVLADKIRAQVNPHPAKQKEMNVRSRVVEEQGGGRFETGLQHKYRETMLFFPSEWQYCHSYCTHCFRWAQFAGCSDLQFASNETAGELSAAQQERNGFVDHWW